MLPKSLLYEMLTQYKVCLDLVTFLDKNRWQVDGELSFSHHKSLLYEMLA